MKNLFFILVFSFLCVSSIVCQSELRVKKSTSGITLLQLIDNQNNIFVGVASGENTTTGSDNVSLGPNALQENTFGSYNTALGVSAMVFNTEGANNVSIGNSSLANNITGASNVAIGYRALLQSVNNYNTSIGYKSGFSTTGYSNTFLGANTGENTLGSYNVFLGSFAGQDEVGSNKLYIENSNADATEALIYGDFDVDELRFNAEVEIKNNLLVEDEVGIGTDSPMHILDIEEVSPRIRTKATGSSFSGLLTENSTRQFFIGTQATYETPNSSSGFHIYDNTASSQRMVIDENGNMGINESDPQEKLHVDGNLKIEETLIVSNQGIKFDNNQTLKNPLSMKYIICYSGAFPSNGGGTQYDVSLIGEVKLMAGYNADPPGGWFDCEGQLLLIADNTALFAIIGTNFGGDGMTTFALPDLRNSVPIHN